MAEKTYLNQGKPWSADEEERLRREFADNMTIRDIMNAHSRGAGAITSRIKKLGLITVITERQGEPDQEVKHETAARTKPKDDECATINFDQVLDNVCTQSPTVVSYQDVLYDVPVERDRRKTRQKNDAHGALTNMRAELATLQARLIQDVFVMEALISKIDKQLADNK